VLDGSQLRCENCGETSAKTTCVSLDEVVELSSGKGTANLVQKVPPCVIARLLSTHMWLELENIVCGIA
jgi:hypothetical protein